MTKYYTTDTDLQVVANAIRTKGGTSAPLEYPNGFAQAIANIPTGSDDLDINDGATRLRIYPYGSEHFNETTNTLTFGTFSTDPLQLDWGDGSTTDVTDNTLITHIYSNPRQFYLVKLTKSGSNSIILNNNQNNYWKTYTFDMCIGSDFTITGTSGSPYYLSQQLRRLIVYANTNNVYFAAVANTQGITQFKCYPPDGVSYVSFSDTTKINFFKEIDIKDDVKLRIGSISGNFYGLIFNCKKIFTSLNSSYFLWLSQISDYPYIIAPKKITIDTGALAKAGIGANAAGVECLYLTCSSSATSKTFISSSFANCRNLKALVIDYPIVPTLSSIFSGTPINDGTGYIYVRDDLVNSYKTSTNWSTYASQIKSIENDLPPEYQ